MRVIVTSTADPASVNILGRLREKVSWRLVRSDPLDFLVHGEMALFTIGEEMIYAELLDRKIRDSGVDPNLLIFASRHESRSRMRCLTVHPVGNVGVEARYGGLPRSASPSSPEHMTGALIALKSLGSGLGYSISYEVTHHGPYLETPAFFIEIGSSPEEWGDRRAADAIAETILKYRPLACPVALGVGGGHYAPRFTDLALRGRACFGHMISKYHVRELDEDLLRHILSRNGKTSLYAVHGVRVDEGLLRSFGLLPLK